LKIYAVIVCYNPDLAALKDTCGRLTASGAEVVLVDNTVHSRLSEQPELAHCLIVALGENTGIAHAQNVGIARARERGAEVIVFFDQDSRIESGFLQALVAPLHGGGARVVAPVYFDASTGHELPSARLSRRGLPTPAFLGSASQPQAVDIVISSGTAATVEVFDRAGVLDEDFFIDYVDTEWCLRCRSKDIPIQVVPAAVMRHSLGQRSVRFGRWTLFVHVPIRCYYQLRNCFLLLRRPHVPVLLAWREILSVWCSRLLLLFVVSDKAAYARVYAAAFRDGVRGTVGRRA
jgi:rhamnosyltransferase